MPSEVSELPLTVNEPSAPGRKIRRKPLGPTVRIALVGCGAATRELHLPILCGHNGVTITALVDRDVKRASELAAQAKVKTVLSDAAALTPDIADAAILCTPPFHHAPGAIDLLRRGFHVMVEKPMATRYEDAEAMVRAAEENGVTLVVTVFRRLYQSTRLLRSLIDGGMLGAPLSFDVEEGEVYNWPTATLGNMRRDLAGGGVLIDFGSHTFDRLFALFDAPGEVVEYRDNSRGGIESDCEIRLRLRHAGRPIEGRVELSRTRNLRNSFRVRCERGTLELSSGDRYHVTIHPDGLAAKDPLTNTPRPVTVSAGWTGQAEGHPFEGFRVQMDDWLSAIHEGRQPTLSGDTVLPSIKLITDCYATQAQPIPEPWTEVGLKRDTPIPAVHIAPGKPKRVLVTGATGFIGGRLAEVLALRDGWQVRALVHNPGRASRLARLPVEMVVGELSGETDAKQLVDGCDAVVHCAIGTAWGDRQKLFDVTVGGTRQLANAALAAGVGRFVHTSTFAVHDLSRPGVIDEATPPTPPRGNDYAESKTEADRVIREAVDRGLCATTLRLANVYGPNSTIFTTRPLTHLMNGSLVLVGPADKTPCSTVYVDTVVEAMVRTLAAPADQVKGQLFTVSEGDDLTWADFYGYFAKAVGRQVRFISDEEFARRNPPTRRNRLGWLFTPFREFGRVVTSAEMWGLTKRVLKSEPLYTVGKGVLETVPPLKRSVTRALGIDAPFVYTPPPAASPEDFYFDLTRVVVRRDRAEQVLGLKAPIPRDEAMRLTLEWARHSRVLD